LIRIEIDREMRMRFVFFDGVVREDEIYEAYKDALAGPEFEPSFDDVVDLSTVDRLEFTDEGIRRLAHLFAPLDRLQVPTRLAIVAPNEHLHRAAKAYSDLRANTPRKIRICRTRAEALAWLAE
jgi:hypothetical protein